MQDPAKKVDVCRIIWLLLKEIVHHELHIETLFLLRIRHYLRQLLEAGASGYVIPW